MDLSASWQMATADRGARVKAFAAARRHSRLVRFLRYFLPVAGVAAVAGFVVATRLALPPGLDLDSARLSVTRNSIIMDHPHLTGFDRHHREYSVAANRAIQPLTNPMQVRLEDIEAKIEAADGKSTSIKAEAGDYNHTKGTLQLLGAITVDSADGYVLRMVDADIDFSKSTLSSPNPISVSYGESSLTGKRLSITDGGKLVVVEGDVHTVVVPPKHDAAAAAAPQTEQ